MVNGLSLGIDEFRSLPNKKKLDCLYENQCKTLNAVRGYKFHQKIQYVSITALIGAVAFIFKFMVGAK